MDDQVIDENVFIGHIQWLGGRRLEIISTTAPAVLKEAMIEFENQSITEIEELIKDNNIDLYYTDDDGQSILEHGLSGQLPPRLIEILLPHRPHVEEWMVNAFESYMETADQSLRGYTQLSCTLEKSENYLDEEDDRRFQSIISSMKTIEQALTLESATPIVKKASKRKTL